MLYHLRTIENVLNRTSQLVKIKEPAGTSRALRKAHKMNQEILRAII